MVRAIKYWHELQELFLVNISLMSDGSFQKPVQPSCPPPPAPFMSTHPWQISIYYPWPQHSHHTKDESLTRPPNSTLTLPTILCSGAPAVGTCTCVWVCVSFKALLKWTKSDCVTSGPDDRFTTLWKVSIIPSFIPAQPHIRRSSDFIYGRFQEKRHSTR